jgi:hypothetical protein
LYWFILAMKVIPKSGIWYTRAILIACPTTRHKMPLLSGLLLYLCNLMKPDYPHKLFGDSRENYSLLMEALAMGS